MNIYKELAADMLDMAKDEFSNHGCNDLDRDTSERIKAWSPTQKSYFIQMADKWNKGDCELTPERLHFIPDWMLMGVLAYILKNEQE